MLKAILSQFKLSALKKLAGQESLTFFEQTLNITPDFYEENSQHDLLAEAITNANPAALFTDKEKRDFFIDRISIKYIIEIFDKINGEILTREDIDAEHYAGLKEYADRFYAHFLEVIGLFSHDDQTSNYKDQYRGQISIKPQYGLYPYQVEISEKTFKTIELGENNRAVIHLPTGAGKTRTAMHIVCRHLMTKPDALVLWLANSDILCEQAAEEFEKAWTYLGNREILRGLFYKNNTFSLNCLHRGFIVGGVQKLHSYYKNETCNSVSLFDKRITFVIFDEAHRALASTYKELVDRFLLNSPNAKLIGLTATPGRVYKDDKPELDPQNQALAEMFGNNKITMDVAPAQPMEYLINKNYLADPEFIELTYDDIDLYDSLNTEPITDREIFSKLSNSKNRNSKILKTVSKEVKKNKAKVILFACDIEHARNLAFALCCLGVKAASVDSKYTSQEEKEQIINSYKFGDLNVLVNVEMLTTGFDAPQTNVAVIARPTESLVLYLQMIGRAIRGNTDQTPKKAKIYTVIDEISDFNNVNLAFKHWNEMWTELETKKNNKDI
ncbi:DEAD/DEAH box helicase [Shewanella sp. S1-49-MNA-CIBAN-0167]|uniref:DEAD/DEAH box helicase n=1 Tax=Shewanella sp. S1-49-MNA-CIBAN-0167 TaxID=3140468 RepID=UPI003320B3A8